MYRPLLLHTVLALLSVLLSPIHAAGAAEGEGTESLLPLRQHSIYAPYVDQDLQNRWFDFGGEAYVNTNKHIRLTQDRQSETGWLWSRLPINVANFQIDIEFRISGKSHHLNGDGMAIWLTKGRATYGSVFGSADQFEGLGLFFDTYANGRHAYTFPRIMAMMGDGVQKYDHDTDGETNSVGACSAAIRRTDIETKVRIIYKKGDSLSVLLQYRGWDEWTPCFEIKNAVLPDAPYLGVTAITGELHDAHDVVTITANSIQMQQDGRPVHDNSRGSKKDHGEKSSSSGGSWLGFLIKVSLFGGVCAAAFQAYKIYYVQGGRWSNKRF
ncbi:hypothetical protein FRB96_001879 [Tulasnella sp. 330]|nr:hypothetical protein FRB96_001879 [Tulasnella sp. 330]KAG8883612.1 hypothetical protein FRB97_006306 [Tulasnella sp. 331]KAG8888937.1 hypothetical protein FRB98_006335 [Tulasnella sp. 332]